MYPQTLIEPELGGWDATGQSITNNIEFRRDVLGL